MQFRVKCTKCGLKYGLYDRMQLFPEDVHREQLRHNCKLIILSQRWQKLVRRPFYLDPKGRGQCDDDTTDAQEQASLVEAEDRASVAKAVLEARTDAYMRAEARACSRIFAATQLDRLLLHTLSDPDCFCCPIRLASLMGRQWNPNLPHSRAVTAWMSWAVVAERAARLARADVVVKAEALNRAMDAVEDCAREAGVWLPPRHLVHLDDDNVDSNFCTIKFSPEDDSDSDSDDSEEYVMNILNGNNDENDGNDGDGEDSGFSDDSVVDNYEIGDNGKRDD